VTCKNDAGIRGFPGAAPPPGHGKHRDLSAVPAVDVERLGLAEDTSPAWAGFNLAARTIAFGVLTRDHER
jgi:phosphatidylethanolamine-binding protein (PEBP) family uncharacterized protein